MKFNEHTGVMDDKYVSLGLEWLCQVQGDKDTFLLRLENAQNKYIIETNSSAYLGKDFDIKLYGADIVASFFSQAKSLLDNRRVYDVSIASHIIPWVKQLGRNCHLIGAIPGARDRARRMLEDKTVYPDTALFELIIAGNYADKGYHVEFIPEQKGIAKTPDLKYKDKEGKEFYIECKRLQKGKYETVFLQSHTFLFAIFYIECKRLQKGKYETEEKQYHRALMNHTETMRILEEFNLWMDITYKTELKDVPHDYIYKHLIHYKNQHYAWDDSYGKGVVRPVSLSRLLFDILNNGSIMFNTKFARLIKGTALHDEYYNIYAMAWADNLDRRFVKFVQQAALVTWRCVNEASFEGRSKHVTSLLKTIDDQLLNYGPGIAHIAIDVDVQGDVADKRRQKNAEAISRFKPNSRLCRTMVHYMVPRIDEDSAWMVDETSDEFLNYPPELGITQRVAVFTDSEIIDNDLPGWRQ